MKIKKKKVYQFIIGIIIIFLIVQLIFNNTMTENNTAIIYTNKGNIEIELYTTSAPITVQNFIDYANSGFYDDTIFHRVIKDFMIQGGGFTLNGKEKETNAPIKNEAKNMIKNEKYTIAMARTNEVDSATSQFFINTNNNDFLNYQNDLNYGYAVFGKVIKGFNVVDLINTVSTSTKELTIKGQTGAFEDWPMENIIIEKIEIK